MTKRKPALTGKQRAFIDHYLISFNATEAARLAGYAGDDASLAVTGHNNLRNTKIAAIVSERMSDLTLTANETLARLSAHATADMADFVDVTPDGHYRLNLDKARQLGRLGIIKKLKTKTRTFTHKSTEDDGEPLTITEVDAEIELYDAQSALGMIGRAHKLFVDRVEHDVTAHVDVTSDEMAQARTDAEDFERKVLQG